MSDRVLCRRCSASAVCETDCQLLNGKVNTQDYEARRMLLLRNVDLLAAVAARVLDPDLILMPVV